MKKKWLQQSACTVLQCTPAWSAMVCLLRGFYLPGSLEGSQHCLAHQSMLLPNERCKMMPAICFTCIYMSLLMRRPGASCQDLHFAFTGFTDRKHIESYFLMSAEISCNFLMRVLIVVQCPQEWQSWWTSTVSHYVAHGDTPMQLLNSSSTQLMTSRL